MFAIVSEKKKNGFKEKQKHLQFQSQQAALKQMMVVIKALNFFTTTDDRCSRKSTKKINVF